MVLNLCLRGMVLLGRFFFLFSAAKFLSLEDLGTYSLLAVTVGYAFYLVGLDFYSFTTRLLIGSTESEKITIALNQFRVYFGSLIIFAIPLLGVFIFGVIEWKWLAIFYSLLVSGHISQEMGRLLISLEQPIAANVLLLAGSATWTFFISVWFWITPISPTLDVVMYSWLTSSVLSVIVGLFYLRFIPWLQIFKELPPSEWVWNGLKTAFPFLLPACHWGIFLI